MPTENFSPCFLVDAAIEARDEPGAVLSIAATAAGSVKGSRPMPTKRSARIESLLEAQRVDRERRVLEARRRWTGVWCVTDMGDGSMVVETRVWIDGDQHAIRFARIAPDGHELGHEDVRAIEGGTALVGAWDRARALLSKEMGNA